MTTPRIVIGILSADKYEPRRAACRATWAKSSDEVRYVFVVGSPAVRYPLLAADVLYVPVPDTYVELPQKTQAFFAWAVTAFPDCQRFLKCDDDTYVNVQRLLEFAAGDDSPYVGHAMTNEMTPYASGGAGYLLDRRAAWTIAENLTDKCGPEDMLVQRVLQQAKIPFKGCQRFHPWNMPVPLPNNDLITTHYQTPEDMLRIHAPFCTTQRIPKTFHFVWLGGQPLPDRFAAYIQTWRDHHPTWRVILWTDAELPALANQREFDAAKNLAQKADILRYELLHRYGGVYVDVDFECLKSIEPLLIGIDGFAGEEDKSSVAIGIMGAVPLHPLFAELIRRLPESFAANKNENIVNATGPGLLTRYCRHRGDFRVFPPQVFYPLHYSGHRWCAREDAYADHHWAGSWRSDHQKC